MIVSKQQTKIKVGINSNRTTKRKGQAGDEDNKTTCVSLHLLQPKKTLFSCKGRHKDLC